MKPIITFQEKTIDGIVTVDAINQVTGKVIERYRLKANDVFFHTKGAEVHLTAKVIIDMIKARHYNYKFSHHSDPRTMAAMDRLMLKASTLATYTNPNEQKAYIKRVLLPDLHIITPRNKIFKQWPRLIELIEDKASHIHTQPADLFSQKTNL